MKHEWSCLDFSWQWFSSILWCSETSSGAVISNFNPQGYKGFGGMPLPCDGGIAGIKGSLIYSLRWCSMSIWSHQQQFLQQVVQAYNKEIIKAPCYWSFVWIIYPYQCFTSQRASDAGISMSWCHHAYFLKWLKFLVTTQCGIGLA